jgi:glycosyltransferase involved in cell wall biosynthesis
MIKFSVVTPSYNQGQFIERTIKSVLTQRGEFKVEYIIMDGGSTDNTLKIIKNYESKIKNNEFKKLNKGITFYWHSNKDEGQSDAINQGLKKATGDVLAYINSDDTYTEGAFQKVSDAFEENPENKWLTGCCNIIDQDDKPIRNTIAKYKNMWLGHYSYKKLLILNFISQPATFWKQEILENYGLFDKKLSYAMDYDYWLKIGKNNNPIIINNCIANFRIHGHSKGETAFEKQFDQDLLVCNKYCKSKIVASLHFLHNGLIKTAYKFIKK